MMSSCFLTIGWSSECSLVIIQNLNALLFNASSFQNRVKRSRCFEEGWYLVENPFYKTPPEDCFCSFYYYLLSSHFAEKCRRPRKTLEDQWRYHTMLCWWQKKRITNNWKHRTYIKINTIHNQYYITNQYYPFARMFITYPQDIR